MGVLDSNEVDSKGVLFFRAPLLQPAARTDSAGPAGPASPMSPYMSALQKPQEPNIDFELDVKVLINSGKCVLHTKDPVKEDEMKL